MYLDLLSTAIPAISKPSDGASVVLTVLPYLRQLQLLPAALYGAATAGKGSIIEDVTAIYLSTNPLIFAFFFSIALGPFFLLLSEINRNYSQVDRAWSILPGVYVAHYTLWAHLHGLPTARIDNACVCAVAWSVRLTFNYWRKGGYTIGVEDYRWQIIKKDFGDLGFFIFNVTFISFAQIILLFLITTPAYLLLLSSRGMKQISTADQIFSCIIMCLIVIEFFADQQQWNYQAAKASYLKTAKVPANCKYTQADLDRGFVVSGLWSWSRHPNCAAEQAIWVAFYQWGSLATQSPLNWTVIGALSYIALFQSSTRFTEKLSIVKYKEYKEYQKLVGMFLPGFLGGV